MAGQVAHVYGGSHVDDPAYDVSTGEWTDAALHSISGLQETGEDYTAAKQLILSGVISPTQLTADKDDYNPTGWSTATVIRQALNASLRTINGVVGGVAGRLMLICNIDTSNGRIIGIAHEAGTSAAGNRFSLPLSTTQYIENNNAMLFIYDGVISRWKPVHFMSQMIGQTPVITGITSVTVSASSIIISNSAAAGISIAIGGLVPDPGGSLVGSDANNLVLNALVMQQTQPTYDITVFQNCSAVLEGNPLRIPSGFMLNVETGAVFIAKP